MTPSTSPRVRRAARRLLRLYPRAWRRRYEAEVDALLGDHPVRLATLLDLVFGAVDAHLHPSLFPPEESSMTQRLRTSQFVICCATLVYAVALISLQQIRDPHPGWQAATGRHPQVRLGLEATQIAGGLAVLAGLAGFTVVTYAMIRQAIAAPHANLRRLLLRAGGLGLGWLAGTATVAAVTTSRPGTGVRPLRSIDTALEDVWLLGTAVVLLAGGTLVWRALSSTDLPQPTVQATRATVALTAVAMTSGLIATVIEAGLLHADEPDLIGLGWLTVITTAMAIATTITALAWYRATSRHQPA